MPLTHCVVTTATTTTSVISSTVLGIYYRHVKVIRLVGRNTVEEIILCRAEHKLQLTHNVMSTTTDNAANEDDEDDNRQHRLKVSWPIC